jgi:hypothetical protein
MHTAYAAEWDESDPVIVMPLSAKMVSNLLKPEISRVVCHFFSKTGREREKVR